MVVCYIFGEWKPLQFFFFTPEPCSIPTEKIHLVTFIKFNSQQLKGLGLDPAKMVKYQGVHLYIQLALA